MRESSTPSSSVESVLCSSASLRRFKSLILPQFCWSSASFIPTQTAKSERSTPSAKIVRFIFPSVILAQYQMTRLQNWPPSYYVWRGYSFATLACLEVAKAVRSLSQVKNLVCKEIQPTGPPIFRTNLEIGLSPIWKPYKPRLRRVHVFQSRTNVIVDFEWRQISVQRICKCRRNWKPTLVASRQIFKAKLSVSRVTRLARYVCRDRNMTVVWGCKMWSRGCWAWKVQIKSCPRFALAANRAWTPSCPSSSRCLSTGYERSGSAFRGSCGSRYHWCKCSR